MQTLFQKWRRQHKAIATMDIFDPKIEPQLEAARKTLLQILMKPIQSRGDAYTVLYAVIRCSTFERPIRRALLNVLRFLHVVSLMWISF